MEGDELGGQTFPTQLETDSRGQKKSPQQTKGFAAATAEVTGESKRAINLNLARAEAIGDAPTRSKGTPAVFQSRVECRRGEGQFFSLPWVVVSTPQDRGQLRSEKRPQPRWCRHQVKGGVGVKNAWGVSGRSTTVQRTLCLVHMARPRGRVVL